MQWRDAFLKGEAGTNTSESPSSSATARASDALEPSTFVRLDPAWCPDPTSIVGLAAVLDPHARIRSIGPNATLLWSDRDQEALLGDYLLDQLRGESVSAASVALAQTGRFGIGRSTVEAPDGSGFVELIMANQTDGDGTPVTVVFAYRVPAPQILSSAPLVTVLLQLASELESGFVAIDESQRLTFVNTAALESFGLLTDPTMLLGTPAAAIYQSIAQMTADPDVTMRMFVDTAASDELPGRVEFTLLDGRSCRAVCATTAVSSKSRFWVLRFGVAAGLPGVDIDTESQRSELVRLHERKSAMLYTASHEVRGTLHGILGLVDELYETSIVHEDRTLLAALSDACSGLRTMVQQVLDVAQLEAGAPGLTAVAFDVRNVLREVGAVVAGMLTHKDVDLSIAVDGDVDTWRMGDPGRIGQILTNLATNAAKAADRGVLGITVSNAGSGGLRFVIGDTGPGMPKFARDRLTEPLPKQTIRKNQTNHGLGLLIARELIELLNGRVEVSVENGVGTTVVIELPLPSTVMPIASVPIDDEPTNLFQRALLVDDSPEGLDFLRRSLRGSVREMDATLDCQLGLSWGAESFYDLVIVDGSMSPHDGADMARALRKLDTTTDAVILVATANAGAVSSSRYLSSGADLVLVKPFSKDELRVALRRVSALRSGNRDQLIDLRESVDLAEPVELHADGVKLFDALLNERVQAMQRSFRDADVDAFVQACHNLGSPAVTVGALRLGRLCLALETVVRTVGLVGVSPHALDEIERVGRTEVFEMLGGLTI